MWRCCGCLLVPLATCAYLAALLLIPGLVIWAQQGRFPRTLWPGRLPHLLLRKGPVQRRRLGRTRFAEAARYAAYRVSEEQRARYLREGWLLLPGVLPPELLADLRETLLADSGAALWPYSINGHYMYDELLDLYLYSPLGSVAAQVFGLPDVELFSDFRYFREPGQRVTQWHFDYGECANFMTPANFTARTRLRAWVTLDDDAPTPELVAQGVWEDFLTPRELEDYRRGAGDQAAGFRMVFDPPFRQAFLSAAARHVVRPRARLGDVLLHSPCLWHASPVPRGGPLLGFLCPTYQPAGSPFHTGGSPENARRNCRAGPAPGGPASGSSCFPPAHPSPEHLRGHELEFSYVGQGQQASRWHWFLGFVGRRWVDMVHFGEAGADSGPAQLEWLPGALAALKPYVFWGVPGVYAS